MEIITQLTHQVKENWESFFEYVMAPLGEQAYALRCRRFVGGETPKLLTICEHQNITLFGVYGVAQKERHLGYCLFFTGTPIVRYYTRYIHVFYSEPADVRTREWSVLHNDKTVRLIRVGIGTFDYEWLCRREVPQQTQIPLADHAVATCPTIGNWKDGM